MPALSTCVRLAPVTPAGMDLRFFAVVIVMRLRRRYAVAPARVVEQCRRDKDLQRVSASTMNGIGRCTQHVGLIDSTKGTYSPLTSSPNLLKASSYLPAHFSLSISSPTFCTTLFPLPTTCLLLSLPFFPPIVSQNHFPCRCSTSVHACPACPALAVRPTRCT